jgi:hypothetical protein
VSADPVFARYADKLADDVPGDIIERTGVCTLDAFSTEPPPPMLIDRLDPNGPTILYGPGGAGKGTLGSWWILQLVRAGKRVLIADYENHPEEWARRIHGLGGAEVITSGAIQHVAPLSRHWLGRRGAIWEQQNDIRELVVALGIDIIVIDSIGFACLGADVSDAATPQLYGAALEAIDVLPVSLAHVPKDGNLAFPFGSVFWHNGARGTWSLVEDGPKRILTHRKHNNYPKYPTQQVEMTWRDGVPVEIWERPHHEATATRIERVLGNGPMSVRSIVAALNAEIDDEDEKDIKQDTLERALRRGAKANPPRFAKEGELWTTA